MVTFHFIIALYKTRSGRIDVDLHAKEKNFHYIDFALTAYLCATGKK